MMPTNAANEDSARRPAQPAAVQTVMIVNGNLELLETFETMLDAGRYDVVFVESSEHAYSHIKRVNPDLILLGMNIDDLATFQLLSMLKLDDDTREIPILTYSIERDGDDADEDASEPNEPDLFAGKPAVWRN